MVMEVRDPLLDAVLASGVSVTVWSVFCQVVGALSVVVGLVVSMRTAQLPVLLALPALSRARYW